MATPHTIYLSLGANVGNLEQNIVKAISLLSQKISNIRLAPLYKTKPFGVIDQPNFLNSALVGETTLLPRELLAFVKATERESGRVWRRHWGERELDIDIIFYDDLNYQDDALIIPHPGASKRDFVLRPLLDLNPELIHPGNHQPISALLADIPASQRTIIS